MRRLCTGLAGELTLPPQTPPLELYGALCEAMGRRRGRPVQFRTAAFPPGTASGLWLDMTDRDLVVIEERTAPDHQLVILGHELWHMQADHGTHQYTGPAVQGAARLLDEETDGAALRAAVHRIAARTRFEQTEEREAETFGLLLAAKFRARMTGSALRGPARRDDLAGRIEASLGYPGGAGLSGTG
ncbi:toxin-antitoxin system, toxin component [Streptomyces sp. NPDC005573]|uniref:toxin-antitoxin system, toxin component n=1 Tax=unclassified Streptomyces TaxID=2593676 RepID=UPI0033A5355C